jgi:hypothetical protein
MKSGRSGMRSVKLTNLSPLAFLDARSNACFVVGIPYLYYLSWKKLIKKVDEINDGKQFMPYNTKDTSYRIHQGNPSLLNGITG